MSGFRRVGPEIPFGEVYIDVSDVQPIHDVVANELLLSARAPKIDWQESSDEMQYVHYFTSLDRDEAEMPNRFVSARLWHGTEPDSWRLAVHHRTFTPSERHTNKRISYRFEAADGRLLQAKKEVFFVLGNSQIGFDENGQPNESVTTDRKTYERALQPKDCTDLLDFLSRSVQRARAIRG